MVRVAVVGLGLMGGRRARIAHEHPTSRVAEVYDVRSDRSEAVASAIGANVASSWQGCVDSTHSDIVIVSTPNSAKGDIVQRALRNGKAVLVEKPAARSMEELASMFSADQRGGSVFKAGFNYRYFRAIQEAKEVLVGGMIGDLINYRIRHGHGGRPGYERDWRLDPNKSGGGQLLDQGCHTVDLAHWFAGPVTASWCQLQSAFWSDQRVEDNAFITFIHNTIVGQIHTSWTEWKNCFSLELFGTRGAVTVEGLGGSYGSQHITTVLRASAGGQPRVISQENSDDALGSMRREWDDFLDGLRTGHRRIQEWSTQARETVMTIDQLYNTARRPKP